MMAFIGVRSSWLMFARNALFARLAAWASSRAFSSSASAIFRSVMSRKTMTAPTSSSSFLRGVLEYSTGKLLPSLRHNTSSSILADVPCVNAAYIGHSCTG